MVVLLKKMIVPVVLWNTQLILINIVIDSRVNSGLNSCNKRGYGYWFTKQFGWILMISFKSISVYQYNNCMEVVRHNNEFVTPQLLTDLKRFLPFIFYNSSKIRKHQLIIDNLPQIAFPVLGNKGDEIPTISRIIPTRHPVGFNSVFVSVFLGHLKIGRASLQLL